MIDAKGGAEIEDTADPGGTKEGTEEPDRTENPREANQRGDDREVAKNEERDLRRLGGKGLGGWGRPGDVLGIEEQIHGVETVEGMEMGTVDLRPDQEEVD